MMSHLAHLASVASLALLAVPRPLLTQHSAAALHATLAGWSEDTWLLLVDRDAVVGGRLGSQGMLARFHRIIDAEYELDRLSAAPGLSEEYAWEETSNGVRYWGGSINHRDLIEGAEFKASIPLAGIWRFAARFNRQITPALQRNSVRIAFTARGRRVYGFADGLLSATKPDMDVVLGAGWHDGAMHARASVALLDVFSDVIYQGLIVYHGYADTAVDYERMPIALRGSFERRLGGTVRVEAHGGVLLLSRVRAYRQVAPDTGFRQEERFGFGGVLTEWAASPTLTLGAAFTTVRASTDRRPLVQNPIPDDYRLVERTTRAHVYLLTAPHPRWLVESWLGHEWRPDVRVRRDTVPNTAYEDRAWQGQAVVTYRAPGGFRSLAAFEVDLRDVIRGDRPRPGMVESLGQDNYRLRLEFGWRFEGRMSLMAGYRVDLDFDRALGRSWFDGAHGRFAFFW